jgi:hypothetical protein
MFIKASKFDVIISNNQLFFDFMNYNFILEHFKIILSIVNIINHTIS